MVNTGVLPFIRGIDLTLNNLEDDRFPETMSEMTSLSWLKLTNTQIKSIPHEVGSLHKLEHLIMKKNKLEKICPDDLSQLPCLRTLNISRNQLQTGTIAAQIFDNEELTTVDFSHNELTELPEGIIKAKSLLVLNISHNKIDVIPSQLFVNATDLLHLDLSGNQLDTLPPQLRRLTHLRVLVLNYNPMSHFQLRPLSSLTELRTLHLRGTHRCDNNFPSSGLDCLIHLEDVDISDNQLSKIPNGLFALGALKRLNLSSNEIVDVGGSRIEAWILLESLILSRNRIAALPNSLCRLSRLKKLYVNENFLDFNGIPSGVGKLGDLEVFSAANNNLEMIPESLCRCGSLKKLILSNNRLITLPDAIHLTELVVLDLKNNPNLIMPPKPLETNNDNMFCNINFSLQHQLRLAGASVPKSIADQQTRRDPIARKLRLRRRHRDSGLDEADEDQAMVIKGMKDVARKFSIANAGGEECAAALMAASKANKTKKWEDDIKKPTLDYSELFQDEFLRDAEGITMWEIDNFYPRLLNDECVGSFYEGDCYVILHAYVPEGKCHLHWNIYYWIGRESTVDKQTCAAMHSVHLRDYLTIKCRTQREEQGEESDEFLNKVFGGRICYMDGARTASGFYTVEEVEYITRTYRVHNINGGAHFEPVITEPESLDPRYVFLVDAGMNIFIWYGLRCKNVIKSKTILMAEKINKLERKNSATISILSQGQESSLFWQTLGQTSISDPECHVPECFTPVLPRLYCVGLGMGYLELPQVFFSGFKPCQSMLNTKEVYILDCYGDMFIWVGKKSSKLTRAAAQKLSAQLFTMLVRPEYSMVHRVFEGVESQIFKTKFQAWDDVIDVDFTREAVSVQRTGADLKKWASQYEAKSDLSALFTPRQPPMTKEETQHLIDEWNEDLEKMESFVLEGKKFVKLPEKERGIFHSADSYVYLCRYWILADGEEEDDEEDEYGTEGDHQRVVVYFWQGREAGNMGWMTFMYGLQTKFEALFGEKLEVVRMHQQQENLKFMSHFSNGLVIKSGSRRSHETDGPELLQIRSNASTICRRCIQIKLEAKQLCSSFCFLLSVPFRECNGGIVYVWIGSKSDPEDAQVAHRLAESIYDTYSMTIQTLNEGEEPENFFWLALGGKQDYNMDNDYGFNNCRLFRCSNDKGFFSVTEKCSDFCQDDLAHDDVMLLDNGQELFIWVGKNCSDLEIKLGYKSAHVYLQNLRAKENEIPRQLMACFMGHESYRFTRNFHGWSNTKTSKNTH